MAHFTQARTRLPRGGLRTQMPRCAALAVCAALLALSDRAFAGHEDTSVVTVGGSHPLTQKQIGRSWAGIPIDVVELTHRVSYRDLDLATPAGVAAFGKRIRATAKEACGQIDRLFPGGLPDTSNRACIDAAVKEAMAQANTVIAAARRQTPMRVAAARPADVE
jgi:UrcA family protein